MLLIDSTASPCAGVAQLWAVNFDFLTLMTAPCQCQIDDDAIPIGKGFMTVWS